MKMTPGRTCFQRRVWWGLLLALAFATAVRPPAVATAAENDLMRPAYVLVLARQREFPAALLQAKTLARRTGLPFSLRGMVFDRKRGLILPDNDEDKMYAGSYYARRFNAAGRLDETGREAPEFISIERAEGYQEHAPDRYLVVGGIYETRAAARRKLARLVRSAPDAYLQPTSIYYGCLH